MTTNGLVVIEKQIKQNFYKNLMMFYTRILELILLLVVNVAYQLVKDNNQLLKKNFKKTFLKKCGMILEQLEDYKITLVN